MVDINWGLMQPGNALANFGYGMQLGRDARQQQDSRELKTAVAGYVTNPNDPNALNEIIKRDPAMGMQFKQQAAQQQQEQAKMQREKAMQVAQLFEGVTPENYGQRIALAQRMGIDVSSAPQQYDPQWVEENGMLMNLFVNKPEALSAFGKQAQDEGFRPGTPQFNERVKQLGLADARKTLPVAPGGGVAVYDPQTGKTTFAIVPNAGQGETGQPAQQAPQGGPQPGTVVGGYRFRGGNPNDRNNWEPAGGQTQPASGNFRPVGIPGERVTSTYRTQQHNREVGGVPNSYHTRRDAQGNPLARDSVPPSGMSMQAYAAQLRRLNPGLQIIVEGDHVHMEPR